MTVIVLRGNEHLWDSFSDVKNECQTRDSFNGGKQAPLEFERNLRLLKQLKNRTCPRWFITACSSARRIIWR